MKRSLLLLTCILFFSTISIGQTTYIPDDNFEQALIDLGYDSGDLDDYVPTTNIDTVTVLDLDFKSISDLTGISDFVELTHFKCNFNFFTTLDVSNNHNLIELECGYGEVSTLNVSDNEALEVLFCNHNNISTIDISNCPNLRFFLPVGNVYLDYLDLSNNVNLTFLEISSSISELDVTHNVLLDSLIIYNTGISELDLRENTLLHYLSLQSNEFESLYLEHNVNLVTLKCGFNDDLTTLDLSTNTNLEVFKCQHTNLTELNIKNGNNTSITTFDVLNNENLNCIEVDDAIWSEENWTSVDPEAEFSEDCSLSTIENDKFQFDVFPTLVSSTVSINTNRKGNYTISNISGQTVNVGNLQSGNNTVNLFFLQTGVYFITVEGEDFKRTEKIVKK